MTHKNTWTPETEEVLRRLWEKEGLSANQIGERMGITRNAVIGKAHRLKLSGRPDPIKRKHVQNVVHTLGSCQWIEKARGPFIDADKCGAKALEGRSYCAEHERRAYRRDKQGKSIAVNYAIGSKTI